TVRLEQGKLEGAQGDCEIARSLDDENAAVVLLEALIIDRREEHGRAKELFQRLRRSFPRFVESIAARAEFAIKKRWLPQGHKYVRLYLQICPDSPYGHQMLGKIHQFEGQWERAVDELNVAIQLKPNLGLLSSLYLDKAGALHELGRIDEEVKCLDE